MSKLKIAFKRADLCSHNGYVGIKQGASPAAQNDFIASELVPGADSEIDMVVGNTPLPSCTRQPVHTSHVKNPTP